MMRQWFRPVFSVLVVVVVLLASGSRGPLSGQAGAQKGEWRTYGGDLANSRYSPLDQITRDNFNKLEVAWRFKTDALGPRPEFNYESTPLMVGGVLYTTAGSRRAVVALDASTGELLWMHSENEGARGAAAPTCWQLQASPAMIGTGGAKLGARRPRCPIITRSWSARSRKPKTIRPGCGRSFTRPRVLRSSGREASLAASSRCSSTAHRTASTALSNEAKNPSPVFLMMTPR